MKELTCLLVYAGFFAWVAASSSRAAAPDDTYTVEEIATPPEVVPECGGISILPDGRVAAVFHHGEVYLYEPGSKKWHRFAEGLHDPLGVWAISPTEIIVTQRPELTRLIDANGDGVADRYECISDAWGLSGNYHEFACGLVRDAEGNFYVPVSNGSSGSVPRYEIRGRFNPDGYVQTSHYSCVPYRGWIVKIAPDGVLTPVACGFRQPNGLGSDDHGRLFATDNQGDWIGTSKLHLVLPGHFYGHAPSLAWRDDFRPGRTVEQLDELRTEGTVLFPHGIMANSPGQPAFDGTHGKFGPFAGQMFVPEFNIPRVMRVMLDEVHGQLQGAVTTFFDGAPLRAGNIRLAFAPDGALWVAQSERKEGWPAGAGLQRIVWHGGMPFEVQEMHLVKDGFNFLFTKQLAAECAAEVAQWKVRRYYYQYHEEYGSPQTDVHEVACTAVLAGSDHRQLHVSVDTLQPGYIYEFTLAGVKAADGTALRHTLLAYTANMLLDGSAAPKPRPPPTGLTLGTGKDKPRLPEE